MPERGGLTVVEPGARVCWFHRENPSGGKPPSEFPPEKHLDEEESFSPEESVILVAPVVDENPVAPKLDPLVNPAETTRFAQRMRARLPVPVSKKEDPPAVAMATHEEPPRPEAPTLTREPVVEKLASPKKPEPDGSQKKKPKETSVKPRTSSNKDGVSSSFSQLMAEVRRCSQVLSTAKIPKGLSGEDREALLRELATVSRRAVGLYTSAR